MSGSDRSSMSNSSFDFSEMTTSVVAVLTDAWRGCVEGTRLDDGHLTLDGGIRPD
jgi:hypothetical protein